MDDISYQSDYSLDNQSTKFKSEENPEKKTPWWVTRDMADHFSREAVLATTLKAFLVFAVYFAAILYCTMNRRHPMMFFFAEALKGQFLTTGFQTINNQFIRFADIRTAGDFWKYSQGLLLDSLYWDHTYSNKTLPLVNPDDRKILHENQLLGVPRMRQLRVRNDSCMIHEYFRLFFRGCYDMFIQEDEDHDAFGKKLGTAWIYSDEDQTKSLSFTGQISTYEGGGYYQDLGRDINTSRTLIQDLFDNLWITRGTRVIFIDFTVYNANMNLFCLCKLVFEFPPTGGVIPSSQFLVTFLDVGFRSQFQLAFAAECIIYILGALYFFEELREMWYFKHNYFLQFWSYMDLMVIALIIANLITSVILFPNVNEIIENILKNENKYGNLEYVGWLKATNNTICAILMFVSCIKLFKYLNFNRTMGQLNNTLRKCVFDIACFTVMFLLIFCAYAELGYLLFGSQAIDYTSFGTAMVTLLRVILGDFDYRSIEKMYSFLAPLFFLSYIFLVFFVLLNMFLAIINDTYADVKTEIAIAPAEMQLFDYLGKGIITRLQKWGFRVTGKRESKLILQNIRHVLRKAGFEDKEIKLFFDLIDPQNTRDHNQILKELENQISDLTKLDDDIFLKLTDFIDHTNRLSRLAASVGELLKRTRESLAKLELLERGT